MPAFGKTQTGFTMYTPQKEFRQTFSHFYKAGIDSFASVASQNPDGFFNLDNVLPSISGGFLRRYGTTSLGNASNFATNLTRLIPYQVSAQGAVSGVFYSGFSNYYSLLGTDNTKIAPVYSEGTLDSQAVTGFSGNVFATVSRSFLYAFDGAVAPQKKHFAKGADPQTNIGIVAPTATFSAVYGSGTGYHPATTTATFVASTTSIPIALTFNGSTIVAARLTGVGTGAGSNQTYYIDPTDTDPSPGHGCVIAVSTDSAGRTINSSVQLMGTMSFVKGRLYAVALKSSKTGHTSDVCYATGPVGSGLGTQVSVQITINTPIDTQADTVVLMATSDGGDKNHLYEVTQIPVSSFTTGTGNITYTFSDTLPDAIQIDPTHEYPTPPKTLLQQNLWVDLAGTGIPIGVYGNLPPTTDLNIPIVHQGRLFATNGKSLFYSKSIDEVTTSTGLITSKWEEAWPSSNRIDIGFDNEVIKGLLSDGTFLYIGTTQNIYRLAGTSAVNFSIEAIFKNIGLSGQDSWTVVYKEGVPAGYMWVTPDLKVMFSDFNNYDDVGIPIYPLLQGLTSFSIQPWVHGPYAFAVLKTNGTDMFVYNLVEGGWYRWQAAIGTGPQYTYTSSSGLSNLFFAKNTGTIPVIGYFDPTQTTDAFPAAATTIPWKIRTGWIDLGDSAGLKVINELECWTGESALNTVVYSRNNSNVVGVSDVGQSRTTTGAPIALYSRLQKAYYAGLPVAGRYFSFEISTTTPGTGAVCLDQFTVEYFPFGRF